MLGLEAVHDDGEDDDREQQAAPSLLTLSFRAGVAILVVGIAMVATSGDPTGLDPAVGVGATLMSAGALLAGFPATFWLGQALVHSLPGFLRWSFSAGVSMLVVGAVVLAASFVASVDPTGHSAAARAGATLMLIGAIMALLVAVVWLGQALARPRHRH